MTELRDVLDLVLRWVHVIAAILWIGNSMLFNWLDRSLTPAESPRQASMGSIWLLHSGAFYHAEKTLSPGAAMPAQLHWFKWQAYTTWLSGAALLIVVYYATGGALLLAPGAAVHPHLAVAIGVGTLILGFAAYEAVVRSPLGNRPALAAAIGFPLIVAIGAGLSTVFSGRAAFLHVGAMLGTIMAGNVFGFLMPAQRRIVGAAARGEPPDMSLSHAAKIRSIHNNYFTYPVIALMLSSHFPGFTSGERSWLALAVIVLGGASTRHVLNLRFDPTNFRLGTGTRPWIPYLAATIGLTVVGLWLIAPRPNRSTAALPAGTADAAGEKVELAEVEAVIRKRCTVCHSASPADRTFGVAPGGIAFDTPEEIRAGLDRIHERAVVTRTMPPANKTFMTDAERAILARWHTQTAQD